jgi:TonB-linked SusC/RagA family outer membrane protein
VAAALEPTNDVDNGRLLASIFGEYEILPSLFFRSSFSLDYLSFREFRFAPTTTNTGAGTRGTGNEGYARDLNTINENYFTYRKNFGSINMDALLGISFQRSKLETFFAQGENYPGNTIKTLNAASIKRNATSARTEWGLNSYFSRLGFNYKEKYYLSGTLRTDGSSRFGANKRWGVFPAGSVAWRISKEGFLKDSRIISELKLSASFGVRGNSEIGNFSSRALIGVGTAFNANYNQIAGLAPIQLANPELTWEEREDFDLGLTLGLFNNRLNITVEAYEGNTRELLLNRPLVFTSGFAGIDENIGSMRNRGLDIGIGTVNISKEKFTWNTQFNLSFLENEILTLAGTPFAAGFASWVEAGQSISSFRGYEVVKIFQTQAEIDALNKVAQERTGRSTAVYQSTLTRPGDIMFKDLNNDGVITGDDQRILGNALPTVQGGLTNNLTFYGFDLSVFIQFTYGNKIYNNTIAFSEGMNGVFGQANTVLNRWTPINPGTNTRFPRAVWQDPNNNRRTSDRFLEDGSFARLKNVTFGYRLPESVTRKLRLSNLRLYVTGQNLVTLTNYNGFDPEVSTFGEVSLSAGTDFLTFPQARSVIFGLNVGF